jgi:hypothetical protein
MCHGRAEVKHSRAFESGRGMLAGPTQKEPHRGPNNAGKAVAGTRNLRAHRSARRTSAAGFMISRQPLMQDGNKKQERKVSGDLPLFKFAQRC